MSEAPVSSCEGFTIILGDRQLALRVVREDSAQFPLSPTQTFPTSTPTVPTHDYAQLSCSAEEFYQKQAEAKFLCCYCDRQFEGETQVTEHEVNCPLALSCDVDDNGESEDVAEEDELDCFLCDLKFSTPDEFAIHQRFHQLATEGIPSGPQPDPPCQPPAQCDACGKVFQRKLDLTEHLKTHQFPIQSVSGQRPHVCRFCDKKFILTSSLSLHEKIHMGAKPFECQICNKIFSRQNNFLLHMRLHASGRRFFCDQCGKWFKTAGECDEHQSICRLVATGKMSDPTRSIRYGCQYCEKKFPYRRDVIIHERRHTGERPFSCGYCGKDFSQQQSLTVHIRIHTGERPFHCRVCEEKFRDSSSLRRHEFVRHSDVFSVGSDQTALPSTSNGAQMATIGQFHIDSTLDQLDPAEDLDFDV